MVEQNYKEKLTLPNFKSIIYKKNYLKLPNSREEKDTMVKVIVNLINKNN